MIDTRADYLDGGSQVLWEDGERVFHRGWRLDDNGYQRARLIVLSAADHPSRSDAAEPRSAVFQFTLPDAEWELTNPLQWVHRV